MEKKIRPNKQKRIPRAKASWERESWRLGHFICGVDEVGRGCLAGPVVTSAVILHPQATFVLLKDSKILTKDERITAAQWIKQHSWYAFGVVSHQEIDRFNIYQGTKRAMKRALMHVIEQAGHIPERIIIDAMNLSFGVHTLSQAELICVPRAEQASISVAAASILAKVKRDELMNVLGHVFPGYSLGRHKGYATSVHCKAVECEGRSIIHRVTFLKKLEWRKRELYERQGKLFG
jgi:ribonuclease HII